MYLDVQLFESGKEVVAYGYVLRATFSSQVVDFKAKTINLSVESVHGVCQEGPRSETSPF
jgi:hypothetical protein